MNHVYLSIYRKRKRKGKRTEYCDVLHCICICIHRTKTKKTKNSQKQHLSQAKQSNIYIRPSVHISSYPYISRILEHYTQKHKAFPKSSQATLPITEASKKKGPTIARTKPVRPTMQPSIMPMSSLHSSIALSR
ncbi:hypothetical protein VTL71DRAFT_54 [Oculimacula yallundae]|uniref:Uncharacterized protein n=1 Tax=Oculimacula yallundae TaxID=86028 RepID=A0ABR4CZ11_9HELO